MKRAFVLFLCIVMSLSLLAACGNNNTQDTQPATNAQGKPIVTIGLPENANVSYEDNTYTQLIEELAGVEIEFVFFQGLSGDYLQQLSLRVASQEKLPDIIWGFNGMSSAVRNSYGEDGVFIDLTDYFEDEEKSALFWERLGTWPEEDQLNIKSDMVSNTTGEIYAFPSVVLAEEDVCRFMPWINKEWLDRLNLPMPNSIESLENTLRAFRDQDPNGDGKKNDIPCLVQYGGTAANGIDYFMNLFMYWTSGTDPFTVDENAKLQFTPTTQLYRDALIWVNKMVEEGCIHKNSFTAGSNDIKQFFATEGMDRLGMTVTHVSIGMATDNNNVMRWVPLEFINYAPQMKEYHLYCTFITKDCQNVDAAWDVLMAMTTREAQMHSRLGKKGVHWDDADPGALTVDGEPAQYKVLGNGDTLPTNNRWLLKGAGVETPVYMQYREDPNVSQVSLYKTNVLKPTMVKLYESKAVNNPPRKYRCPDLEFTSEDANDAPGFSVVQSLVTEWRIKFMAGDKDPNSADDWAEYISLMEKAGLQDYIEVAQVVYDRDYKDTWFID